MQYCRISLPNRYRCAAFLFGVIAPTDMNTKKTVVLGATTNPARTAFQAVHRLVAADQPVVPVGIRSGEVAGLSIQNGMPLFTDVDTVTLYIGPDRQPPYYDYILHDLQPKRIIFNPGTENPELALQARQAGIETLNACTLVMLATGQY